MARSRKSVNHGARKATALERMKMEVASELGISEKVRSQGWATMTSADCGRVGGHMVRKMVQKYESSLGGSSKTSKSLTSQHDI